jgi:5-methylcytosine-specific restriction endonuclease McrA
MPVTVTCIQCGKTKDVIPARRLTFKFCSYACRSEWRKVHWSGENHPGWTGGEREKVCQHCGNVFKYERGSTVATFRRQKFCSKACADIGGLRYFGSENANWNGDPRRKHRESKHAAWRRKVISRDHGRCRTCGAKDVELHAHHVKSYRDHPDLRFEVANGLTLCAHCHWQIHAKPAANGVNSGKPAPSQVGGNPEPSFGRKPIEGATTRGRAYRRWEGSCDYCGSFLSRTWSDVAGKANLFCSKSCAGKFKFLHGQFRPNAYRSPRQ